MVKISEDCDPQARLLTLMNERARLLKESTAFAAFVKQRSNELAQAIRHYSEEIRTLQRDIHAN